MWGAGWGYWGWGWWFWVFWAFWAILIFLFIWFLAAASGGGSTQRRPRTPEEQILRERFARGEISREEFNRRLRDLRRAA